MKSLLWIEDLAYCFEYYSQEVAQDYFYVEIHHRAEVQRNCH
jgi:hypothetical protein